MKHIPYTKTGDTEKDFYLGGPHRVLLSFFMTAAVTTSSFDHFLWDVVGTDKGEPGGDLGGF